ncbi:hypothetical protein JKY79_02595, partial [Candidatus Babeliales bacterium]|nr:hypothetical protein [Candidatus Babeliales bacterium]
MKENEPTDIKKYTQSNGYINIEYMMEDVFTMIENNDVDNATKLILRMETIKGFNYKGIFELFAEMAIKHYQDSLAKLIIQKCYVTNSLFQRACERHNFEIMKYLISRDIDARKTKV